MTICVHCGKTAISKNSEGQPTCKNHKDKGAKHVSCPVCGSQMRIRSGRYGYFWGCSDYPECQITEQLKEHI